MRSILLILMLFVTTLCKSQASEYYNVNRNFLREDSFKKALIIHTDEYGKIVWAKELHEFAESQDNGQYIVAVDITVKNGKILGNPSDYDYWIVLEEDLVDNVKIYPTLCDNYTMAFVGFDIDHQYECRVYNLLYQEMGRYDLKTGENIISTVNLRPGQYLIESYRDGERICASKIMVIR